jgi:hypothetical protein
MSKPNVSHLYEQPDREFMDKLKELPIDEKEKVRLKTIAASKGVIKAKYRLADILNKDIKIRGFKINKQYETDYDIYYKELINKYGESGSLEHKLSEDESIKLGNLKDRLLPKN